MPVLLHHASGGDAPRSVFLAVPSYGPVTGPTAFSLFRAHPALLEAGFGVHLGLLLGDCHVDDARNRLARDFLATDCTDFVFIDADVGFEASDLLRLLSHDRDIVGGTYPLKQAIEQFPVRLKGGEVWADADGLIEVDGLPTGFLRIRRAVLEKLARLSVPYRFCGSDDDAPASLIFERTIVDGGRTSGDYSFCNKARAAGYKLYADPECYLSHTGDNTWLGSLGSFLKRRAGVALNEALNRITARTERDCDYITLIREWNNDPWQCGPELLKTAVAVARQARGVILETGCGLTTLAMAAANPAVTVHALEHQDEWALRVEREASRLGLSNVVIHRAPLKAYATGRWYELPRLPWGEVDVVLCDGPPRQDANRRILFGVMATHDARPRCVLVDDATTEGDAVPPEYRTEIMGELRKFAVGLRK